MKKYHALTALMVTFTVTFNALANPWSVDKLLGDLQNDMRKKITPVHKYPSSLSPDIKSQITNYTSYQDPRNFFANGIAPKNFVELSQQRSEWIHNEQQIVDRVKADQLRKDLVTIAVIDIGADLGHPELKKRLAWDIGPKQYRSKNGKIETYQGITGIGYDFIGNDNWASPVLLDPWIYSIGSKGFDDQMLIVDQIQDPINYLTQINDSLMNEVIQKIQSSAQLSKTFFSKMTLKNTNVIGLLRLMNMSLDDNAMNALKSRNLVLSPSSNKSTLDNNTGAAQLLDVLNASWIMDSGVGLPDFFSQIPPETMAGISELQTLLKSIFTKDNADFSKLMNSFSNVAKYFSFYHFDPTSDRGDIRNYSLSRLSEELAFKKLGSGIKHPAYQLFLSIRKSKILNPDLKWADLVENTLNVYRSVIAKTALNNPQLDPDQNLLTAAAQSDELEKFLLAAGKDFDMERFLESSITNEKPTFIAGLTKLIRKYALRVKHALYHPESIESDHGSHVGGTAIGYLDDNYRLFPIRVNLGLVKAKPKIQKELIIKNLTAMKNWFKIPAVSRAVKDFMVNNVKSNDFEDSLLKKISSFDVESESGRTALAETMSSVFGNYLISEVKENGIVGLSLMWEIRKAVELIAQRKIHIANLSLGGMSEQPEFRPTMDTPEERLNASFGFIFSEFEKYMIADAITTTGKNTTFFMAAGNSNNFADGKMRSNYPADLRSKWLEKYVKSGEDTLPGTKTDNVAVVMSLNERGELSNFTNIIFTNKYKLAMRGEDVQSMTLTQNLSGSGIVLREKFGILKYAETILNTLDYTDSRFTDALNFFQLSPETFEQNRQLIVDMLQTYSENFKLIYNDGTTLMDGTSMATPMTASFALKLLREKLTEKGVTEKEAYGKFNPSDLLKLVSDHGTLTSLGDSSDAKIDFYDLEKNDKAIPDSAKKKAHIAHLNRIKNSKILCERFYERK